MEKLGIQPTQLLLQAINFAIMVVVLTKLLYKPITSMLEKRRKEIEEGLALTDKLREEEEKLKIKREKILDEARAEGRRILEEAKVAGKERELEITAAAQREATEIVEKGKADAKRIHDSLADEIRKESVKLAAEMAGRILAGMSASERHKIISRQLRELSTWVKTS